MALDVSRLTPAGKKYLEVSTNPFGEDPEMGEYGTGAKIPDKLSCDTFTIKMIAEGTVPCGYEAVAATGTGIDGTVAIPAGSGTIAIKMNLPGPDDISGLNDAGVIVQHYDTDGNAIPTQCSWGLKWNHITDFRGFAMKYRIVGGGLKVWATSGADVTAGIAAAGYSSSSLINFGAVNSGVAGFSPIVRDYQLSAIIPFKIGTPVAGTSYDADGITNATMENIRAELKDNRYPLNPMEAKNGVTVRWRANDSNDLEFLPITTMLLEETSLRSNLPTVILMGTNSTTTVYVKAVLHVEMQMTNYTKLVDYKPSPYDPQFESLFHEVNSDNIAPLVVSGHSFSSFLKRMSRGVRSVANRVGKRALDTGVQMAVEKYGSPMY